MTRLVAAALAVTCVLGASALARKAQVSIESRGRVLVAEATLNQRVTGRFIVDTGASLCVVSRATADEANLTGRKDGPITTMMGVGGIRHQARIAQARRIDMGDASARDVDVAVVDGDPIPGFDGLIGLSFLHNFKYSIDAERGVLILEN